MSYGKEKWFLSTVVKLFSESMISFYFHPFLFLGTAPFAYFILNMVWMVIIELFVLSSGSGENNAADLHMDFLLFFYSSDSLLRELHLKCKLL